ncbi:MAG: hypothetical protein QOH36_1069 [Actinomycetota bacterium]|nr:hypothetical protein [Actinomycetota bacterium]MEA2974090.1 hypothetical protein [Actinomycetota bacterium]
MTKREYTRKLTLTRETLRTLTASELRLVAGGRTKPTDDNCTGRYSGCISRSPMTTA